MVEEGEEFCPELSSTPLLDREVLEQRIVQSGDTGTVEQVAARIPVDIPAQGGIREGRRGDAIGQTTVPAIREVGEATRSDLNPSTSAERATKVKG